MTEKIIGYIENGIVIEKSTEEEIIIEEEGKEEGGKK